MKTTHARIRNYEDIVIDMQDNAQELLNYCFIMIPKVVSLATGSKSAFVKNPKRNVCDMLKESLNIVTTTDDKSTNVVSNENIIFTTVQEFPKAIGDLRMSTKSELKELYFPSCSLMLTAFKNLLLGIAKLHAIGIVFTNYLGTSR